MAGCHTGAKQGTVGASKAIVTFQFGLAILLGSGRPMASRSACRRIAVRRLTITHFVNPVPIGD